MDNINKKINSIVSNIEQKALLDLSLVQWREKLSQECQVYVFGPKYLAKRFDQINYEFCPQDTAKEILVDNLYALLRYKYFKNETDEVTLRINEIVKSFTTNLKTSLIKVSFNDDEDCKKISWLPNGCVAFRNGAFDFRNNKWLFKYQITKLNNLQNTIYLYDPNYIIGWYVNINFEPWDGININDFELEDFVNFMREWIRLPGNDNGCFKLMYNMSFDILDKFEIKRFKHLCEIMGYLCYQSFVQKFVLLVGSGQNGKNSLLDGCFTDRIVPKPASVDIGSIETDKFGNSVFENRFQNIYLETSTNEAVYKDNTNLKALTGSQDQMVEYKGKDKQSGLINCKWLWSANDQDRIKFSDTTEGFKRRINIFEIWYHWDSGKKYLEKGDYYESTFSEDLSELKGNLKNIECLIYLAMFGIKSATNNFTKSFDFTENDWKQQYTDIDFELKEKVNSISRLELLRWIKSPTNYDAAKALFYDSNRVRFCESQLLTDMKHSVSVDGVCEFFNNDDDLIDFFIDDYLYMSINAIQSILGSDLSLNSFTGKFKKAFNIKQTTTFNNNRPYVKVKFVFGKLKVLED